MINNNLIFSSLALIYQYDEGEKKVLTELYLRMYFLVSNA